jgi:hypothetical protein
MEFTGRRVQFWLSPGAREALGDLVPVGRGFEALVVEEDGLGLWLGSRMRSVRLVKTQFR